jgi:hypothetical protein
MRPAHGSGARRCRLVVDLREPCQAWQGGRAATLTWAGPSHASRAPPLGSRRS